MAAQVVSSPPSGVPHDAVASVAAALTRALFDKSPALSAVAAVSLGHIGLRGPLPLPMEAGSPDSATAGASGDTAAAATPASTSATAAAAPTPAAGCVPSVSMAVRQLATLMQGKDLKMAARVAVAAGQLAAGHPVKEVQGPLVEGKEAVCWHE